MQSRNIKMEGGSNDAASGNRSTNREMGRESSERRLTIRNGGEGKY